MDEQRRETLFRQMIDEHSGALARLCAGYERTEAKRHELQQEILLNLWRALPSFREEAALRTWMYRVAHNVATRHVQQAVRRPREEQTADVQDEAPQPHPDELVEQKRARQRLRSLVAALRALDRQIIMLYLEDVAQTDIAEVTGLSQANVSTRVHRIKAELLEKMKQ